MEEEGEFNRSFYENEVLDVNFEEERLEDTFNDVTEEEYLEEEVVYNNLEFRVFTRQFKGQTSGPEVDKWTISCFGVDEFKDQIWNRAKKYCLREILMTGEGVPTFSDEISPIEEGGKFIIFNDKTGKRTFTMTDICKNTLDLWQPKPDEHEKRDLNIYIHHYGLAVSSLRVYQMVKNVLELPEKRDRAGKN